MSSNVFYSKIDLLKVSFFYIGGNKAIRISFQNLSYDFKTLEKDIAIGIIRCYQNRY